MATAHIISKINQVKSEALIQELEAFVDYLLIQQKHKEVLQQKKALIRKPKFGCAKGMFIMAPDFDAPLEDFSAFCSS